jgi:DNA-binding MarR family transcriptional regulator
MPPPPRPASRPSASAPSASAPSASAPSASERSASERPASIPPRQPFELTWLLSNTFRALTNELNARLAEEGFPNLRSASGFAFQRMAAGGASSSQLAGFLGVSKQAAGQLVDELEAQGLARRTPGPDGRTKTVVLTERGWECTRAATRIGIEIEQRWAAALGTDRLDGLVADLRAIAGGPA